MGDVQSVVGAQKSHTLDDSGKDLQRSLSTFLVEAQNMKGGKEGGLNRMDKHVPHYEGSCPMEDFIVYPVGNE